MYANLNDDPTAANCTNPAYENDPACNFEDETPWKIGLGVGISIALAALIIYSCRKPFRHMAHALLHKNEASDAKANQGQELGPMAVLAAPLLAAHGQQGQPLMPSDENPYI
jgi:hypothetical protein